MKNNTTQMRKSEQETKAVDTVISILLVFTVLLLAFCLGYYVAMNEAAALIKTIVN